jgi:hypothetical protein
VNSNDSFLFHNKYPSLLVRPSWDGRTLGKKTAFSEGDEKKPELQRKPQLFVVATINNIEIFFGD